MPDSHPLDLPFSELFARNPSYLTPIKIERLKQAGVNTPRDFILHNERALITLIGKGAFLRVKGVSFSLGAS